MLPFARRLATALALPLVLLAATAAYAGPPTAPPRGATNPRVLIVEVTDFQCPFCDRAQGTLDTIAKQWPDDVQLVVLHNPLAFHQHARAAAIAALAADQQQAFWPLQDLLFAGQRSPGLDDAALLGYAQQLGLDLVKFKLGLADPAIAAEVDRQQRAAVALGATGTPSFFVNGKQLRGAQPFEMFAEIIKAEIDASVAANKRGTDWVKARTKAENPALADFVFDGTEPPRAAEGDDPSATRVADQTVYKVTVGKDDAILGDSSKALVTLVVFSEFQCPFCGRLAPTLAQLRSDYGDSLRIVFKHNPLPFHERAEPAAAAAICAQAQGKFWELHDKLFGNQSALEDQDLRGYAKDLGLDMTKFGRCLGDKATKARIAADIELAGNVTARGTPNAFVNGRKITGAKPIEEFKVAIDAALIEAKAKVAAGTAVRDLYDALIQGGKVHSVLDDKVNTFVTTGRPRQGAATAKVEVVVFSDFQCPFCSRLVGPLKDLVKASKGKVSLVYKHFPLSFHERALPAAKMAVCAEAQKKFWPLYELLFDNQRALEDDDLASYARSAKLDAKKLDACMASEATAGLIEADMAEARAADVKGTPTVFINGRKFNSPSGYTAAALQEAIDKL